MKIIIMTLISLLFSGHVMAENFFCKTELETLPIQQNGRVKPLFVHASEVIKQLTGKSKLEELSAVEAFCLLSMKSMGLPSAVKLFARIDHVDAMKFLGLQKDQHEISYEELLAREDQIKLEARTIKDNESYKKAMGSIFNNLFLYKEIIAGENWTFANKENNTIVWLPLNQFLTEEKVITQKNSTPDDPFTPVLTRSQINYQEFFGTKYLIELYYAKANLVSWALLITLLALGSLVLTKNLTIPLILAGSTVLVQATLITLRVIISGRAPITNMYETVLFSGFGALFLSLILGHFKKNQMFIFMGLCYNVCTLMMLNFANGMLSATIGPLVPVLRDNFWLSTHVTTVILSYGALALSWILANTVLIRRKFYSITKKEETEYSDVIYTTLKWGTTMLGAGVILGGVWADYSWGRFWGWDPKETWSLIVLCVYMAILHGRYTNWIKNERFITITAAAFLSVMMAWFGVNYILATGLHSYGFSEGGAVFLGSFYILQITLIVITYNHGNTLKES
jgi:cytochrome c-type biogenesis protein CcsB